MPKLKKAVLFLLIFALIHSLFAVPSYAEPQTAEIGTVISLPNVSAKSAILMEAESGTHVYEKNADVTLPMASTTKIMTALVALKLAPQSTVITVDASAVGTEGSSVYLTEGEQLTLEQLLYALLLESANDAAVAIAVGLSGSVEAFVEQMNAEAIQLGLANTHFQNPHGLDAVSHHTTASELATIARHALQNDLIRTIVSTRKTTIPHAGEDGVRLLVNHNKLLRMYEDCIGVKTGYTSKSGRCLVSAAERDGVTMIAVTLDAPNDWNDHKALLDYGFSKYTSVSLCEPNELQVSLPIVGGTDSYVMLSNLEQLRAVLPCTHGKIRQEIRTRRFEFATVNASDLLGSVVFFCDTDGDGTEEIIGEAPLHAVYSVQRVKSKVGFWQRILSFFRG